MGRLQELKKYGRRKTGKRVTQTTEEENESIAPITREHIKRGIAFGLMLYGGLKQEILTRAEQKSITKMAVKITTFLKT